MGHRTITSTEFFCDGCGKVHPGDRLRRAANPKNKDDIGLALPGDFNEMIYADLCETCTRLFHECLNAMKEQRS